MTAQGLTNSLHTLQTSTRMIISQLQLVASILQLLFALTQLEMCQRRLSSKEFTSTKTASLQKLMLYLLSSRPRGREQNGSHTACRSFSMLVCSLINGISEGRVFL